MATFNISLNDELVKVINQEIKKRKYANRSEFFRELIRNTFFPINEEVLDEKEVVELTARIRGIKKGREKIVSLKEFDKKFNLKNV